MKLQEISLSAENCEHVSKQVDCFLQQVPFIPGFSRYLVAARLPLMLSSSYLQEVWKCFTASLSTPELCSPSADDSLAGAFTSLCKGIPQQCSNFLTAVDVFEGCPSLFLNTILSTTIKSG